MSKISGLERRVLGCVYICTEWTASTVYSKNNPIILYSGNQNQGARSLGPHALRLQRFIQRISLAFGSLLSRAIVLPGLKSTDKLIRNFMKMEAIFGILLRGIRMILKVI
jgi:hypothetical protein